MNTYKLLTPGPLTTTDTVKEEMLVDRCTWDDDYKAVTQKIRRQLLQLGHVSEDDYTAVLMQGSGTFGVESVLSSVVGDEDKVLICSNGAYGVRMTRICDRNRIPYVHYAESYDHIPDPARVARLLAQDPAITHVAMVHSETTSGILNDIQSVGKVVRDAGRTFIVDAMSSFGGVDIPVSDWGIDFLVSSANKCIQGVPGFSFILCRRDKLLSSEGKARSLSLDLLDQWKGMEKDGKWRFTSPTHVVLAFSKALDELEAEGGIPAGTAAMPRTTACSLRRCAPWDLPHTSTGADRAPSSPPSSIPPGYPSSSPSFTPTSRSGATSSTRASSPMQIPSGWATSERSTRRILRNLLPSSPASWLPIRRRSHDPGRHL